MKKLNEKISFLQGLGQGMNIADGSPQGKMIIEMLGVLSDIADNLNGLRRDFESFRIYVESIDDDLFDLTENLYRDEDDEDDFVQVNCRNCGEDVYFETIYLNDEDTIEIVCPNCDEVVYVNDGSFDFEPEAISDILDNQKQARQDGSSPNH
ncbi:MAG: AraC family transcriptional regulator [Syntrophomonadaceae bacterium]|nr:AraC family transcriptional regulator [Syntrophomonadaceae bacterium]